MKNCYYIIIIILSLILSSAFITPLNAQEAITIAKDYVYIKSKIDTMESSRIIGFEQAKRLVLDELETNLNSSGLKILNISKDRFVAYLAGIVIPEISNENWDKNKYSFKIKVQIHTDEVVNFIKLTFKNFEKTEELEDTKKITDEILKRIKKFHNEAALNKNNKENQLQYLAVVEHLNFEQIIEKGYAFLNKSRFDDSINTFDKAIKLKTKQSTVKQEIKYGTVTAHSAHLRSQPSRDSITAGYVAKGTKFLILDKEKDKNRGLWYRIRLPVSKKEAWIASSSINMANAVAVTSRKSSYSVIRAYIGRGSAYLKSGKPSEAINDFNKAIQLNPNSASAYNYRGMSYIEIGNHKQAIEDFSTSIELKPNRTTGYINRGFVYTELEDFKSAKNDFDYAIYMEPKNEYALLNRGRLYAKTGYFKEAIKDYDMVIKINPGMSIAYAGRGTNYAALKDYENASKDLNYAIELNPNNTDALFSLGTVYLNMGEKTKALDIYKAAARLGDKDAIDLLKKDGVF